MLSNFTWWQFFGTFLLLCAFYYPFVLWLYYKPNLQLFFQKLTFGNPSQETAIADNSDTKDLATNTTTQEIIAPTNSIKMFSALEEDVRSGIKAAKDANADKAQVLGLLKNILLKYPELKQPGEQVKVNELLIQECGRAGYVLYMAEAYALWPNTPNPQA